jgi:SulP family sulfate permease
LIGIAVRRWLPVMPYMIAAMVGGSLVAVGWTGGSAPR